MSRIFLSAFFILAIVISGCNTGGGLQVGEIEGPTTIGVNETAHYSVTVSNGTGLVYQWAVDPPSAGYFINTSSSTTDFFGVRGPVEDPFIIRVSVSSNEYAPVVKELKARFVVVEGLDISRIIGPRTIRANATSEYRNSATGDTGINYEWSVEPPSAGYFIFKNSQSAKFVSSNVQALTDASIIVTVASDLYGPETETLEVTIEPYNGDPSDIYPPEPFTNVWTSGPIFDIAMEGDGDMVFATYGGLLLYSPYGVLKRVMSNEFYVGLVTSNLGILDTGRGVVGISQQSNGIPDKAYDDAYVEGGVDHVTYNVAWWAGEPDPFNPDGEIPEASTAPFSIFTDIPYPVSYHPQTGHAYQKVFAPLCIADSDVEWPVTNVVDPGIGGAAILAYHKDAPGTPEFLRQVFEGGKDFVVYYDYPDYLAMYNEAQNLGVIPACATFSSFIMWDPLSTDFMSDIPGLEAANIGDFEFDLAARLVIVVPDANCVVITQPVEFNQPIAVQTIIGNPAGIAGTAPGEFDNPTAVAIDYSNNNILVADTGNGRVQVFNQDGTFLFEFGGDDELFEPGAIRIDSTGSIIVLNTCPLMEQDDSVRVYSATGGTVGYSLLGGNVYDAVTNEPLVNARIFFPDMLLPQEVVTNTDGQYVFVAIPAGDHLVKVQKYGYEAVEFHITPAAGNEYELDVYLEPVEGEIPGFGHVTGKVYSSIDLLPMGGLTVAIVDEAVSNITNGEGEFTLYNVPEGEQLLRIQQGADIYYEEAHIIEAGQILDLGIIYIPISQIVY